MIERTELVHLCRLVLLLPTSLADARDLCFGQGERVKAVTLNGEVIARSGNMTGGVVAGGAKADQWSESNYAELKTGRDKLVEEKEQVDRELNSGGKLREQDLQNKIYGVTNRLQYAAQDGKTTGKSLQENKAQRQAAEAQLAKLDPQVQKLEASLAKRQKEIDTVEGKISVVEKQIFSRFSESLGIDDIRDVEKRCAEYEKEQASHSREVKDKKITLQNEKDYLTSRDLLVRVRIEPPRKKSLIVAFAPMSRNNTPSCTQGPLQRMEKRIQLATSKLEKLEETKTELLASEVEAKTSWEEEVKLFEDAKSAVTATDAEIKEILKGKSGQNCMQSIVYRFVL
jgi:structural maintenance of chromosome 1